MLEFHHANNNIKSNIKILTVLYFIISVIIINYVIQYTCINPPRLYLRSDFATCFFYNQFHKTNMTWLLKLMT